MRTRAAVLLLAGVLSSRCASPAYPARTQFQRELSAAIEEMEKEAARRRRPVERPQRTEPRVAMVSVPFAAEPDGEIDSGDRLIMPVTAEVRLQNNYGAPRSGGRRHQGLDLFAPRGTPVIAAAGGVVARASYHPRGGNCLWVTAVDGSTFYYAHLDRFAARLESGESVRAGDLLGYVGTTGNASGGAPHLHFEVHRKGEATNPYPLLIAAQNANRRRGSGSLAAR